MPLVLRTSRAHLDLAEAALAGVVDRTSLEVLFRGKRILVSCGSESPPPDAIETLGAIIRGIG